MRAALFAAALAASLAGCSRQPLTPADVPAHFTAMVVSSRLEAGNGPNGYYSQYDVFIAVPPSTRANAGLVVPSKLVVYISHRGATTPATPADIRAGDQLDIQRDPVSVGYGAVQSPPGTPVYDAVAVTILR